MLYFYCMPDKESVYFHIKQHIERRNIGKRKNYLSYLILTFIIVLIYSTNIITLASRTNDGSECRSEKASHKLS